MERRIFLIGGSVSVSPLTAGCTLATDEDRTKVIPTQIEIANNSNRPRIFEVTIMNEETDEIIHQKSYPSEGGYTLDEGEQTIVDIDSPTEPTSVEIYSDIRNEEGEHQTWDYMDLQDGLSYRELGGEEVTIVLSTVSSEESNKSALTTGARLSSS